MKLLKNLLSTLAIAAVVLMTSCSSDEDITLAPVVGDTTAPTVLSVVPADNATSIAVNSNITATFSEAMDASTISAATFTLKQGTTK